MNLHPLLGALTAAALLSGCGDGDKWVDKGPPVSERREVGSFDSIDMQGAARLQITIGEPTSVLVSGQQSVVERVETSVSGSTLRIKTRKRDWVIGNDSRLTVQITVPRLEFLELEGGNDVRLTGFRGGETRIKAAGAANIEADGELDELNVRMIGAGHANLSKLAVVDATVTVDGVGSVIVNPRDSLDATMNGVGAIFYIGTPQRVNTRMNGLGTIAQRPANEDSSGEDSEPSQRQPIDPDLLQPEREDPKPEQVDHESGETILI